MDEEERADEAQANTSEANEDGYFNRKRRLKRKPTTRSSSNSNNNEPHDIAITSNRKKFSGNENCETPLEDSVEINNPRETETFKISLDGQLKAPPEIEYQQTPQLEDFPNNEVELINERVNESVEANTNASSKISETYELEKFEKHALLILNQENIQGFKKRFGTDKDVEKLHETFSELGFEVDVKHDLEKREILEALIEFSSKDFSGYGCVAVAVLTHGTSNGLLRAMDQQYSEQMIIKHFKIGRTPTLAGKPKILIIQACRGSEDIKGVPVLEPHREETEKDREEAVEPYTVSVESDMLVMHSSYYGKPSHRDEHRGTWFVQSLCRKIKEHAAATDMDSILTEVKREVAINYWNREHNRKTHEFEINKQMPVTTSTLTRKLFLRKFGQKPVSPPVDVPPQTTADIRSEIDGAASSSPKIDCFSCFLDYYEYMKKCLKIYIDDCRSDVSAASFYKIACALEDNEPTATSDAWNRVKQETADAIALHLYNYYINNTRPSPPMGGQILSTPTPSVLNGLKYLRIYRKKH